MNPARGLRLALQLLTRVPVPRARGAADTLDLTAIEQATARAALACFPLVGVLLGGVLWLAAVGLPGESGVRAALVLCLWVALTGALHLDGLGDSADAWLGGGGDRARSLEILRDPHLGSAGAVAVALVLIAKYAALAALLEAGTAGAIAAACVLARAAVPVLYATTPYVRPGGMGERLAAAAGPGLAWSAAGAGAALVVLVLRGPGLVCLLAAGAAFAALRHLMCRRLGGTTGDTTGALVELSEAGILLAAAMAL